MRNPIGLLLVAVGAFSIAGGIYNWDWFMENRKARAVVALLTRNGARLFYVLAGLIILVIGALGATGVIDMSK